MALGDQVTRLQTRLTAYPGIRSVWLPMPDDFPEGGALPAFGVSFGEFEAQSSNVTIFDYPIVVTYLHEEFPGDWDYVLPAVVMNMPQNLFAWLAADEALVHGGYGIDFAQPAGNVGLTAWWDRSYSGCDLYIRLKEKENTVWA